MRFWRWLRGPKRAPSAGGSAAARSGGSPGPDDDLRGLAPLMPRFAAAGNVRMVRALLDAGTDVDAFYVALEGGLFVTALHSAAVAGQGEVVSLLVGAGARPDLRSSNGWTAADWAAASGHDDVASLLRDSGAPGTLETEGLGSSP